MTCPICGAAHTVCRGTLPSPQYIIDLEVQSVATNMWTSDRRLYLDATGKAVEADSPDRVSLLVSKGGQIPIEQAESLGLINVTPAEVKAIVPKANKLRVGLGDNKASPMGDDVITLRQDPGMLLTFEDRPDDADPDVQEDGQGLPPVAEKTVQEEESRSGKGRNKASENK